MTLICSLVQYTPPRSAGPSWYQCHCPTPHLPLRRQLSEQGDGVDHGSRLVGRRGQAPTELMPQGNHVMRQIEAIVLENGGDARNAIEGIGVLDRNHLPNKPKTRGRV